MEMCFVVNRAGLYIFKIIFLGKINEHSAEDSEF